MPAGQSPRWLSLKMTQDEVLRNWLLASPLNFTRYMFKSMYRQRFIVGRHHELISEALHRVLAGECRRLIINIAPRYGKTELAVKNFVANGLAVNPRANFMHLSYSDDLVELNSIGVKAIINDPEYQRLFPGTVIKRGADTKKIWATTAGGGFYSASTIGQVTGFGAGIVEQPVQLATEDTQEAAEGLKTASGGLPIDFPEPGVDEDGGYLFGGAIIIDDPIKPEDALSDQKREAVNRRFETTIRSRTNSRKTPIIVIMQRVHDHDLCGYLMEAEPDEWEVLSLPCITEEGEPLWPYKHTLEELQAIEKANDFVYQTQYMQNPTPIEGLMYREFKTYEILPHGPKCIRCNYTDTADTGADYLCSIDYLDCPDGNYIIDVLYTKKPMEYTEQAQADMMQRDEVMKCRIESNNGGRGYRRNVERISREQGNAKTHFIDFQQTKNKQTRIFTASNEVCNMTYFPADWKKRWPQFAHDIIFYRKEGGNLHDDGPDAITGTYEHRLNRSALTEQQINKIFRRR